MRYSLIAIFTLGIFSLTPSPAKAMDLKKDLGKNLECVKSTAKDSQWNSKWCITSTNKVFINVDGRNTSEMGTVGKARNIGAGYITQYEIENGDLVDYSCKATTKYSLECRENVKKSVIGSIIE